MDDGLAKTLKRGISTLSQPEVPYQEMGISDMNDHKKKGDEAKRCTLNWKRIGGFTIFLIALIGTGVGTYGTNSFTHCL